MNVTYHVQVDGCPALQTLRQTSLRKSYHSGTSYALLLCFCALRSLLVFFVSHTASLVSSFHIFPSMMFMIKLVNQNHKQWCFAVLLTVPFECLMKHHVLLVYLEDGFKGFFRKLLTCYFNFILNSNTFIYNINCKTSTVHHEPT